MEEQKIESLQFVTGNRSNIRNTTMCSHPNHDNIWKLLEVLLLVRFLFNFQVDFVAQSFLTNDFLWSSLPTIWKTTWHLLRHQFYSWLFSYCYFSIPSPMRISKILIMQLHVGYKSQNILSIGVEVSFVCSSS